MKPDGIDDTPAIRAAVAKLKANGGGTLFFPRGRFQMTETIELPPNSVLKGMGADHSQIYWPDTFEPLDALVRGTHSFEVSDIFLTCGNHKDGIVGNWPEPRKPLTPEERAADPWDAIVLEKFKVSQALENPLGKQRRLGYIKYEQIPKPQVDRLVDGPMESGRFAFASLYADAASEGKVIYGTTTLKAKSPITVKFEFSGNCLFFVNGKIVGTTLGRGQWGFARLEEGENKIEMIMLPSKRDEWRFGLPRITWVEKVMVLE